MNDTLALPPRLVMRDLMLTAISQKARVCLIFFCIMALSVVIAVQIQPDYKARASLLVLLGTEHTFRPAAGQQFTNSGGVDAEQVLRTESSILGSDDLHRTVIREIGIDKMYPKLLEKPGPIAKWIQDTRRFLTDTLGTTEKATERTPPIRCLGRSMRSVAISPLLWTKNPASSAWTFPTPTKTCRRRRCAC